MWAERGLSEEHGSQKNECFALPCPSPLLLRQEFSRWKVQESIGIYYWLGSKGFFSKMFLKKLISNNSSFVAAQKILESYKLLIFIFQMKALFSYWVTGCLSSLAESRPFFNHLGCIPSYLPTAMGEQGVFRCGDTNPRIYFTLWQKKPLKYITNKSMCKLPRDMWNFS